MTIICSCTLQQRLVSDTGRYLLALYRSPFLKMAVTFAVRQSFGMFPKAFDRVPHERLLKKLDHYGIRDSTQGWIKALSC
jgi:hypothetical protein